MLGAVQVGMLRALVEAGVRPDLVVGTSIGALNGAVLAALPPEEVADRLDALWRSPDAQALFAGGRSAGCASWLAAGWPRTRRLRCAGR